MNPIVFALRRPVTVMVAVVAVALGSGLAVRRMPVDIFPSLNLPVIYVCQPYGGMDPAQMEGLLTNYYEYHFLYISGIHHVEIAERPGHGPDEAVLPSRHRHGPGDGRDDRLRQPLAGLHAAGHRLAVRHAVRHRQRAGRLPRALERDASRSARFRTRRCSRSGRCSPACRASRPRRRSAAAQRTVVVTRRPASGCSRTACRPTRSSRRSRRATSISPSGNMPDRRQVSRSCRSTRSSSDVERAARRSRSAPGAIARLPPRRRLRCKTPPTSPPATRWSTAGGPSTSWRPSGPTPRR